MHGGIIELDSLAYPYRPGAYDYDPLLLVLPAPVHEGLCLIVLDLIECGVEIRGLRLELGSAGVNHLEDGPAVHGQLVAGELLHVLVQKAQLLAAQVLLPCNLLARNLVLEVGEVLELGEEPLVYLRDPVYLLEGYAALYCLVYDEYPFVRHLLELVMDLLVGELLKLGHVHGGERYLGAADGLHHGHLEAGAYRHHLSRRLHPGA